MVFVVLAVDGKSAPKVTVFSDGQAAAQYAANMAADGWNVSVNQEMVLSTVPVTQKHNLGFVRNPDIGHIVYMHPAVHV